MNNQRHHRAQLEEIARREMLFRGFLPDFSDNVMSEIGLLTSPADSQDNEIRDLRHLLWCSIDNDDSMDLDQLTAAEALDGNRTRVWVSIADVDALVNRGSAVDAHALHNTTSIYTAAVIFPMLPEKLSTNLTSLNPDEDRVSMVVEMVIQPDGMLEEGTVYRALVHNYAKLAMALAAWLDGHAPAPDALERVPGSWKRYGCRIRPPNPWKPCATATAR